MKSSRRDVTACQVAERATHLGEYRANATYLHNLQKDGYKQKLAMPAFIVRE